MWRNALAYSASLLAMKKKVAITLTPGAVFTTIYFLRHLQIDRTSVISH
jgi:hypothetical protein